MAQSAATPRPEPDDYALPEGLSTRLREAVEANARAEAAALVADLHVADLADLIEQMPAGLRRAFLDLSWDDLDQDFVVELEESTRDQVLAELGPERVAQAARELDSDDVVYLLEDLDEGDQEAVLEALDPVDRVAVSRSLTYPEYSAGRLMQSEFVRAPAFWTVGQMIDALRASEDLPAQFYDIIVVDPAMRPVGKVALSSILGAPRPVVLSSLMDEDFRTLSVLDKQEDVAYAFNQYHLVSCPVIDDDGRCVGVITIDDAMVALDQEAEEDIKRLGGVGDEEISEGLMAVTRQRFPWLGVNLLTAIIASLVIALFDDVITEVVALAVLMPIVASMGGNAGTQTLTVAVRALATRDLTAANMGRIVVRELGVGLLNGVLFAVVMGLIAWGWFADITLGWVIAVAMVVNLGVAGLAGILIPIGLDKVGADPALASGTFVTTVTDVVGFFAFLGLAALVLL
ncbi:MAG: magnesium transporter [Pseudomonadota bacterium]